MEDIYKIVRKSPSFVMGGKKNTAEYVSIAAMGKANVTYRIDEWCGPIPELVSMGYGPTCFKEKRHAIEFAVEHGWFKAGGAYLMRALGRDRLFPLPPRLHIGPLHSLKIEKCDEGWPHGTWMFKEVLLLGSVPWT